jgi:hypothetical protein
LRHIDCDGNELTTGQRVECVQTHRRGTIQRIPESGNWVLVEWDAGPRETLARHQAPEYVRGIIEEG